MSGHPSMPSQTTDLLATGPTDHGLLDRATTTGPGRDPASPLRMAMRRFRRHRLAVPGSSSSCCSSSWRSSRR